MWDLLFQGLAIIAVLVVLAAFVLGALIF